MKGIILRSLEAIDWDFATSRVGYVAPPHWYPGTFIPALSDALVEALSPNAGTIFDPYGGIGTTGWSALRAGRSTLLADLNPVALLVSYSTNALLALASVDRSRAYAALGAVELMVGGNKDLFAVESPPDLSDLDERIALLCAPGPDKILLELITGESRWDSLARWVAPATLSQITELLERVFNSPSAFVRVLGLCMLSATLRSLSSQHASWGHIADNVRPREFAAQNVDAAIGRWLQRTKKFVTSSTRATGYPKSPRAQILRRDWSKPSKPGPAVADLLLTSPPYADAIDYTLAQRLSLYLLGYDDKALSALVSDEIGARRKRSKTTSRTQWSEQLCTALNEQVGWLKPEGAICLVLPHKDSGRSAGEDALKVTLEGLGWRLGFERDRSIHQSHTRQSWTSIKKETILVFSR